ncbi:MAG: Fe-S cluster assembly protein SufD [Anaerolineales bacterium]|nr:Fe-S cluster assembly protein SufD [Anaerolineales bacterium]
MAASTAVTRTRRSTTSATTEFPFSREMIPDLAPGSDLAPFLRDYRSRAWGAYQTLPMPSINDEAWRRTDLRGLDVNVRLPEPGADQRLAKIPRALLKPIVGKGHGGQIVLLPGGKSEIRLDAELSRQGVVFTDLRTAEKQHAGILANILGQVVKPDEGKFAALAAAMSQDGVLVYVPRFVEVKDPLHSILWGPGSGLAYFSHLVVWLDEGASATYVHESASPSEANGQALHAGTVEIHVGEGANLRFVELQSWGEHVWHFSHERARIGRDGNLDWTFGAVGSRLTKNFSELDLVGQGATGRMSGFYFTDGVQHLDHDTQQNHLAPHTTSDLLFKGALKDRSRSVWQGMIYVAPGAQKADGYQANRNLTLSANARADSIPGLEILADDVRCTHGATVGKMDSDQVFYLRSRGIPYREAERLIVEGFFDPIMQRIPFEGVRQRFQRTIETKME